MPDYPTQEDLFQIGAAEALSRETLLSRAAMNRRGSTINVEIAAGAAMADDNIGDLVRMESGLYLDSAQRLQLDRLVFDRYGLVRKPAAPALVTLLFTVPAPLVNPYVIPANTQVSTSTGQNFYTVRAATILAGASQVEVFAASEFAGAAETVIANVVVNLQGAAGAPTGLAVTNPAASVGAADEEKDDELRSRARAYFPTLQRATLVALVQAARSVPGVATAFGFETLDELGRPYGDVEIVVGSTFFGELVDYTVVPPTYAAMSNALAANVSVVLEAWRAGGVPVRVTVANTLLVAVRLALTVVPGTTNVDEVVQRARAAVVIYVNSRNPGQPLSGQAIVDEALRLVTGLLITGNEVVSPAATIGASPFQVLRTTLDLVTAV